MDAPRVVWWAGMALFLVGVVFGIYWGSTAEGLAALGGPVLILMGALVALLVTSLAVVWSVLHRPVLPVWMLATSAVLAVASGGLAAAIVSDASRSSGFDLPVALLVVALVGLGVVAWGWRHRSAGPA